ncbi:cytochrome c biogenesis protein CcdA [Arthrobacter sp. 4R501]|nr:cytochrome c biogenesis protein CcdA [Arthrobacter sp. 4R501]
MGPVLSAVLSISVTTGSAGRSTLLAFAYCLGLGIPFALTQWARGGSVRP